MHQTVCLPIDCVMQSKHSLIPAVDVDFREDLFMGKVIKVSQNGQERVFKSASYGSEDQLKQGIDMLQQISESWKLGSDAPRVPRLLGLVTSKNQIAGVLEEYVDGENLSELNMAGISTAQRRK